MFINYCTLCCKTFSFELHTKMRLLLLLCLVTLHKSYFVDVLSLGILTKLNLVQPIGFILYLRSYLLYLLLYLFTVDDTALNNIDVGCCKVPKGHSWITLKELNKKNNNLAHDYVSTSTDQPVASLQPTSPTKATNIIQPGSQEEESMTNFETTHQSTNIINSIIESLLKGWTTHKRGFILRKSIFKWTQPISSEWLSPDFLQENGFSLTPWSLSIWFISNNRRIRTPRKSKKSCWPSPAF